MGCEIEFRTEWEAECQTHHVTWPCGDLPAACPVVATLLRAAQVVASRGLRPCPRVDPSVGCGHDSLAGCAAAAIRAMAEEAP